MQLIALLDSAGLLIFILNIYIEPPPQKTKTKNLQEFLIKPTTMSYFMTHEILLILF